MKWTTKQPKVSGYYWMRRSCNGMKYVTITSVTISDDPEWPRREYDAIACDYSGDLPDNAEWAGPIPPLES